MDFYYDIVLCDLLIWVIWIRGIGWWGVFKGIVWGFDWCVDIMCFIVLEVLIVWWYFIFVYLCWEVEIKLDWIMNCLINIYINIKNIFVLIFFKK